MSQEEFGPASSSCSAVDMTHHRAVLPDGPPPGLDRTTLRPRFARRPLSDEQLAYRPRLLSYEGEFASDVGTVLEQRVSTDISAFMTTVAQFQASGDREKRLAVCRWLQREVASLLGPKPAAVPYGSFKYGLYLPWASDLDVVLTEKTSGQGIGLTHAALAAAVAVIERPPIVRTAEENATVLLEKIASHLESRNCLAASPVVVPRARVPFLQIWVVPGRFGSEITQPSDCPVCLRMGNISRCPAHAPILVQLSLGVKSHVGLSTSNYVFSLVKALPALKPLTLVMKHVLVAAGLSNAYRGGLSSHSALLLVVAFLRHFHAKDHQKIPVGRLLLELLQWYGNDFAAESLVVTPGDLKSFLRRSDKFISTVDENKFPDKLVQKPFLHAAYYASVGAAYSSAVTTSSLTDMLVICDPMDSASNVSRSCWRWLEVRAEFEKCLKDVVAGKWWHEITSLVHTEEDREGCMDRVDRED